MSRHPSGRASRADLEVLARRMVDGLRRGGAEYPEVAAAALVARGAAGGDRHRFARRHGVDPALLARIEAGRCPMHEVPAPLRLLTPLGAVHSRLAARLPSG
jgi:hypothetical protein